MKFNIDVIKKKSGTYFVLRLRQALQQHNCKIQLHTCCRKCSEAKCATTLHRTHFKLVTNFQRRNLQTALTSDKICILYLPVAIAPSGLLCGHAPIL